MRVQWKERHIMSATSTPIGTAARLLTRRWRWPRQVSTFEKVIVANSAIIVLVTAAGWWITQYNPETYHYLIDTGFIALAALLGVVVNFALLRAAFAPLHSVLATIRAVEQGNLEARAEAQASDADALALARAFNAMLDRLAQARDETAARVLLAQEEERRRLALELHDQTGQSLTALTLHAEAIAQRLAGESSDAAAQARLQAGRLATLAQRTLAEVQSLSRELRPPALDDLGLPVALRWLAEDASERLGVRVEVRLRGAAGYYTAEIDESAALTAHLVSWPDADRTGSAAAADSRDRLPDEVETALFRIAQESLTNAVRHGQAQQVSIVLRQMESRVLLTVADDGRGFDPLAAGVRRPGRSERRGLGLEGMAERARLLGGALRLRTRPGHGCIVRVTAPLQPAHAPATRPRWADVPHLRSAGVSVGADAAQDEAEA
jgi:two-component system, NarL family, sensor histidine kinase UhpB